MKGDTIAVQGTDSNPNIPTTLFVGFKKFTCPTDPQGNFVATVQIDDEILGNPPTSTIEVYAQDSFMQTSNVISLTIIDGGRYGSWGIEVSLDDGATWQKATGEVRIRKTT